MSACASSVDLQSCKFKFRTAVLVVLTVSTTSTGTSAVLSGLTYLLVGTKFSTNHAHAAPQHARAAGYRCSAAMVQEAPTGSYAYHYGFTLP